jgi:hypothetical protein
MSYEQYFQNPGGIEASRIVGAAGEMLRCVWSNHPHYERGCRTCIPIDVVTEAWRREIEEYGKLEGFFYFSWTGGVWLAYGMHDGCVRGVYCPPHCAERTANLLRPERMVAPGDLPYRVSQFVPAC